MSQVPPFKSSFSQRADVWVGLLKSYDGTWTCLHCKTETNYVEHIKTGSKPCYNCGSTSGEIK